MSVAPVPSTTPVPTTAWIRHEPADGDKRHRRHPGPVATVVCACIAAIVLSSDFLVPFVSAEVAGRPQTLFTDHDVMVAAGAQARLGHLERAYDFDWMTHAAPSLGVPTGRWSPYTYPPTAALVFALVAALPALAGFLVTQAIGLVTFFSGIAHLAAPERRLWLVALDVPIARFNIRCGQNGLLSAGIAAHAIALLLAHRPVGSGLVAALATLKPHLALGVPALLAARREGRGLLALFAAAVGLVVASVVEFGVGAWSAFATATSFAGRNLDAGTYPLARFSSIHAAAHGLGLRGPALLATHVAAFAALTSAALVVARCISDERAKAAVLLFWSTLLTPYLYDYDMAILVVVAALLCDVFPRMVGGAASVNTMAVVLLAQFGGFVWWTFNGTGGVSAFVVVPLFVAVLVVVDQDDRPRRVRAEMRCPPAAVR